MPLTAALCAIVGVVVGCGGANPAPTCDRPEMLRLDFAPYAQLNHDREGYPRSVVVRTYQLQDVDAFEQAGFDDMWLGDDRSVLGDALVGGPDELTLVPSRRESRDLKRNPKATHLGFAANFREHHATSGWKATVPLPKPRDPCATEGAAASLPIELANYILSPMDWSRPRGATR